MRKRKAGLRITAMLLIISLVLAITGCSGTQPESSSEAPSSKASSQAAGSGGQDTEPSGNNELPFVKDGTVTLTYAGYDNWYTPASYTQNLPVWAEFEKRTGVKIEWQVTAADQYDTAIQTRIAAGVDLPDIMLLPGDSDVVKLANDGVILPLKELIDQNAPNIQALFEKDPEVKKLLTAPDGEIYSVAEYLAEGNSLNPRCFMIRKDWLDKLGLKMPETIDDWYTVLKAFKEQDPNGNGQADEVPVTTAKAIEWGYGFFASGFGLPAPAWDYYPDENGKVYCTYQRPEFKELLVFLNKLYQEGIMDPQYSTNGDEAKVDTMISKNIVGCSMHFSGLMDQWTNLAKGSGMAGAEKAEYRMVAPPLGPNGEKPRLLRRGPLGVKFSLTKNCKDPELAIKWIDYVWASDEGSMLTQFGIEGQSFEFDGDGNPVYTEWAWNYEEGMTAAIRSLGGFPALLDHQRRDANLQAMEVSPNRKEDALKLIDYFVPVFPDMLPIAEESDKLAYLMADMDTYISEMTQKFVMGTEPLDNYDKFLQNLESMGLEEVLSIKQAQYDRYLNS